MENNKYLVTKIKKDNNNIQIKKTVSTYDESPTQYNDSMDYGFIDNKYLCRKDKTEFNSNNKKVKETTYSNYRRFLKLKQKIFNPLTGQVIDEINFDYKGDPKPKEQ
ncbi:hypothetical protein ['Camptotheca acuminata' phytoplasma]|uniref:hypothetical protein n=1 Tax='Camptotheca acuminata' phytoplasma TaxID=3239192 RepID=UPI00351A838C